MRLGMHRRQRHALTGKLVMLFLLMAILFSVLLGAGFRIAFRGHFQDVILPHLFRYMEYVQQDMGMPPNRERARQLAESLNIDIHIFDEQGAWSARGEPIELAKLHARSYQERNGVSYAIADYERHHFLLASYGNMTVAFSVMSERPGLRGMRWIWPTVIALLMLMILYHAIRHLFRPIDTIHEGVQRYTAGDLDHRIVVHRKDELGQLAHSINGMAAEIKRMLDAKRELLLAVSHELRSPLTRAKVSVELIDDPLRRQQLHDNLDEIEALVHEILETERLSDGHKVLNRSDCDLNELIHAVIRDQFGADAVVLRLPDTPLRGRVDAPRMRLLIRNLIDNALRYTPDGAQKPVLELLRENALIVLTVRDFGPGVDPVQLPHLTEPFYRVDAARQRDTGGYGLGLYLCRMIAEAHGGTLVLESTPGQGTLAKVALPAQ